MVFVNVKELVMFIFEGKWVVVVGGGLGIGCVVVDVVV